MTLQVNEPKTALQKIFTHVALFGFACDEYENFEWAAHSVNKDQSQRYISNLTGIRAWLSVWIVLFHYTATPLLRIPGLTALLDRGHVATDFFLILSGFIISLVYFPRMQTWKSFEYAQFLMKRFARLYPLHLLTFLTVVGFYLVLRLIGHMPLHAEQYSFSSALLNILMIHAWIPNLELGWNFVSWSISAEWFAYLLLFGFVLTGWRRLSQLMRALLVLTLFLLYSSHVADMFLPERLIRVSFAFLYGVWLFHALPWFAHLSQLLWRGVLLLVPILVWLVILKAPHDALHTFISPLWGLFIVALYYERGFSHSLFANTLALRLGEISFSTYLVHGVMAKALFSLSIFDLAFLPNGSSYFLLPLAVCLTLLLSDFVHHRIEQPASVWVLKHGYNGLLAIKNRRSSYKHAVRGFLS